MLWRTNAQLVFLSRHACNPVFHAEVGRPPAYTLCMAPFRTGDLSHVSPVSGEFDSIEGGGNSKTGGSKLGSAGPDDVQHF